MSAELRNKIDEIVGDKNPLSINLFKVIDLIDEIYRLHIDDYEDNHQRIETICQDVLDKSYNISTDRKVEIFQLRIIQVQMMRLRSLLWYS